MIVRRASRGPKAIVSDVRGWRSPLRWRADWAADRSLCRSQHARHRRTGSGLRDGGDSEPVAFVERHRSRVGRFKERGAVIGVDAHQTLPEEFCATAGSLASGIDPEPRQIPVGDRSDGRRPSARERRTCPCASRWKPIRSGPSRSRHRRLGHPEAATSPPLHSRPCSIPPQSRMTRHRRQRRTPGTRQVRQRLWVEPPLDWIGDERRHQRGDHPGLIGLGHRFDRQGTHARNPKPALPATNCANQTRCADERSSISTAGTTDRVVFARRTDPERMARRLIAQLERLGHSVALQTSTTPAAATP